MAEPETTSTPGTGAADADHPSSHGPDGGNADQNSPDSPETDWKAKAERWRQQAKGWKKEAERRAQRPANTQWSQQPQQQPQQPAPQQPSWGPDYLTKEERDKKQELLDIGEYAKADQFNQAAMARMREENKREAALTSLNTWATLTQAQQAQVAQQSFWTRDRNDYFRDPTNPIYQRAMEVYDDYLYDPTKSQFRGQQDQEGRFLGLLQLAVERAEIELKRAPSRPTGDEFIEPGEGGTSPAAPKHKQGPDLLTSDEIAVGATYGMTPEEVWEGLPPADKKHRQNTGKPLQAAEYSWDE